MQSGKSDSEAAVADDERRRTWSGMKQPVGQYSHREQSLALDQNHGKRGLDKRRDCWSRRGVGGLHCIVAVSNAQGWSFLVALHPLASWHVRVDDQVARDWADIVELRACISRNGELCEQQGEERKACGEEPE
jgi:hypothetical protein